MRKKALLLIAAGILLVAAGVASYLLFLRPEPKTPPEPPPEITGEPEAPALPDERHAVLNLYFGSPFTLRDIDRMELNLLRADLVTDDGLEYAVSETSSRIMVQRGVAQKVLSARIFHGRHALLRLTFGPTARIFRSGGASEVAFLPSNRLNVEIGEDIPLSRTLAVLMTFPASASLGDQDGTATLRLPSAAPAETALLGGFFLNPRDDGQIYEPDAMTISGVIEADLGLDITPREGRRGSPGFGPAPEGQPQE